MLDHYGRTLNRLADEGYTGGFYDSRIEALEKQIHKTYHLVRRGIATLGDFKIFVREFYEHYSKHAPQRTLA